MRGSAHVCMCVILGSPLSVYSPAFPMRPSQFFFSSEEERTNTKQKRERGTEEMNRLEVESKADVIWTLYRDKCVCVLVTQIVLLKDQSTVLTACSVHVCTTLKTLTEELCRW